MGSHSPSGRFSVLSYWWSCVICSQRHWWNQDCTWFCVGCSGPLSCLEEADLNFYWSHTWSGISVGLPCLLLSWSSSSLACVLLVLYHLVTLNPTSGAGSSVTAAYCKHSSRRYRLSVQMDHFRQARCSKALNASCQALMSLRGPHAD